MQCFPHNLVLSDWPPSDINNGTRCCWWCCERHCVNLWKSAMLRRRRKSMSFPFLFRSFLVSRRSFLCGHVMQPLAARSVMKASSASISWTRCGLPASSRCILAWSSGRASPTSSATRNNAYTFIFQSKRSSWLRTMGFIVPLDILCQSFRRRYPNKTPSHLNRSLNLG